MLFSDGWMAITRLDPFRVDWRCPDGSWIRGSTLPVPIIRYTARERAARERRTRPAQPAPKGMQLPAPRGVATHLPPYEFALSALSAATDGRLLVRRTPSADADGTRYWIINRAAQLDGELLLLANEHIVGFGRETAYVAEQDLDDLWRVRRHPWPPLSSSTRR